MTREELEEIINDERSTELAKVCTESALKDLRIKELEEVNDELEKVNEQASKDIAEQCKKIKELEDDKLRQENYCESLVNENKRLNEIIISKDMVGAELVNENKALRHNIEDYKCDNEALKARIKELEDENNNNSVVLLKQSDRIKELEGVVSKLENTQKWISVDDVKPQWGVLVKIKFKDGSEDERRFSYDYKWVSKGMKTCESVNVTHWMPLPPCHTTSRHVTTTEESSVIEKEG